MYICIYVYMYIYIYITQLQTVWLFRPFGPHQCSAVGLRPRAAYKTTPR